MYSKLLVVLIVFLFLPCDANAQFIRECRKLTADDSVEQESFGGAIDMDNSLVVISARGDGDNAFGAGSAYVFNVDTGAQISKLLPSEGSPLDRFGWSVALSNNTVVVGCPYDDELGFDSGSVYLFDAVTGVELKNLMADDGRQGAYFGFSVAMQGDLIVIGAPRDSLFGIKSGAAYIFDAVTGVQIARLSTGDIEVDDLFGSSVAIDNGLIAVSAPSKDVVGDNSGAVYLFDSSGAYLTKITPADGQEFAKFGNSLDIDDGLLVVGSRRLTTPESNAGAVYVFETASYQQVVQLFPPATTSFISFGIDVAIDNGFVVVGTNYSAGFNSAYVYVFDAQTGEQVVRLKQSDFGVSDKFGSAVDIQGSIVLVGAFQDDEAGTNSGSVYQYSFNCRADFTGDCALNVFDVSAFLSAFASNDIVADFNADGTLNFFDIAEFLRDFLSGCR